MKMNYKSNHLSRIRITFSMVLFVMCFAMNALFCGNYNPYESLDQAAVIEAWTISEGIVTTENNEDTLDSISSSLNKNDPHAESIANNRSAISMMAAVPDRSGLFLFLIIAFLDFFLNLFILLPDGWTLITHKVRLDN